MSQQSESDILFQACRAVGTAFRCEADREPKFKTEFDQNREYWDQLTTGLLLTTFCHLVESKHGTREELKSLLSDDDKAVLDILFHARNAFIHCGWDISKMTNQHQATNIRTASANSGYQHPTDSFKLWLDGDMVHMSGLEPLAERLIKT